MLGFGNTLLGVPLKILYPLAWLLNGISVLLPVLPDEVNLTRQFWMYCREDLRKLKRITLLWDYIREVTELTAPLLLGETRVMRFVG